MKTLEQYAEEWSSDYTYANGKQDVAKESFIAGATSDWVKIEKIKAQIEVLQWVDINDDLEIVLKNLQEKLKELEK